MDYERYYRLFHLELNKDCRVSDTLSVNGLNWQWSRNITNIRIESAILNLTNAIGDVLVFDTEDSWSWNINHSGIFVVNSTRKHIDKSILPSSNMCTTWMKYVPSKINILLWRLNLDRLPTRLNLAAKGLEVPSLSCPVCNSEIENRDHLFFNCNTAASIWLLIRVWVNNGMVHFNSLSDWQVCFDNWKAPNHNKNKLYDIFAATIWLLWRYKNNVLFNDPMKRSLIFDCILLTSFTWIRTRGR
ncbi:uncharacterized protein [Rutidosis leptorrhynchoides]|uniref:uncharacterized protein n=1 Tax=Rutidosis leptorrhynchoides TaxID=125765 RepID=UPI003A9941E0